MKTITCIRIQKIVHESKGLYKYLRSCGDNLKYMSTIIGKNYPWCIKRDYKIYYWFISFTWSQSITCWLLRKSILHEQFQKIEPTLSKIPPKETQKESIFRDWLSEIAEL